MNAEKFVRDLFSQVEIEVNGSNPWDPQVHNPAAYNMMVSRGSVGLGETYMHGYWDCEQLDQFFARVTSVDLRKLIPVNFPTVSLAVGAYLKNRQLPKAAWEVGRMHYDLPDEVWEATLDSAMTGSCAYYRNPTDTLEEAQLNKCRMTLDKVGLKSGHSLLDIGVGWAAFSGLAAQEYGAHPIGITVSEGQKAYIHKRYGEAIDVRVNPWQETELREPVDCIVSAEMFEHVGSDNYRSFFEFCRRSIKEDGLMNLHTIVRHTPSKHIDPWMDKYIYPGGCIPTLGQITTAVHGLFHVVDVHDIGGHYPATLRAWMDNFRRNWDSVKSLGSARLGMDPEVFCRMWLYHYMASAGGFMSSRISVHQIVLSPNGVPGRYQSIR